MSARPGWPGRPPGLSLHLGPDLERTPTVPRWVPEPRRVDRVRTGSSLCPRLLSPPDRLRHAAHAAQRSAARLELETPPLGDRDLDRLRRLLDRLDQVAPRAEVVVNDWGALRVVRREHPSLVPVIGRVLHRQMRDPRIPAVDPARLGRWPVTWGRGAATSPSWIALVRRWGVGRIELDWPLHGLDRAAWRDPGVALSLHLPLALVAAGRSCLLRDPRGAVDRADGGDRCDRSCTHTAVHLEAPWTTSAAGAPAEVLRLGNAELVRLPAETREAALAWAADPAGPDRVVLFPEEP